jgi:RNA polymerase sigma-70 factor (ECF subfamily)
MTAHSAQHKRWTVENCDLELVRASKEGDMAAFEELVKRYDRKLYRIAQSVTHNREDSQDAVQEAFLKTFQHLAEFREASEFSTWLIRITLNQSLMKLRKRNRANEFFLDDDLRKDGGFFPRDVADWAPNAEQLYWAAELRNILTSALEELSPISRTVFVLRDVEGLSIEQTGMAMNLSSSAVKARLWRVRLQLRERLNRYFIKDARSARAEAVPLNNRTGRILGLVAECLHYPMSGSR